MYCIIYTYQTSLHSLFNALFAISSNFANQYCKVSAVKFAVRSLARHMVSEVRSVCWCWLSVLMLTPAGGGIVYKTQWVSPTTISLFLDAFFPLNSASLTLNVGLTHFIYKLMSVINVYKLPPSHIPRMEIRKPNHKWSKIQDAPSLVPWYIIYVEK